MQLADLKDPIPFTALTSDAELCTEAQKALSNEGLYTGAIDGIYGPNTENGLVRFKRNHKLSGGNFIGPTTATYLMRAIAAGVPSLVTATQASAVYGSQLYPTELADLNAALSKFGINQPEDIREFLAQTAHESGGLRWLKELADGWAYEGRTDLGNVQAGDGPRFKGGGAIQLTGRANYQSFCNYMADARIMEGCDYVASVYPFSSAGFWWFNNGVSKAIANGADIYAVTRIVNGGLNGIDDRIAYYQVAQGAIS